MDTKRTSPYQFYQFWLNASDEDAEKWIKIFTLMSQEEINLILTENIKDAGKRLLQKTLAAEVTKFVHGDAALAEAISTTEKLFANQTASAESLSVEELEGMDGIVKIDFAKSKISGGLDVVSFLSEANIFPSKGEARKLVQGGGVSINRQKVNDIAFLITNTTLLHDKYIIVQKGKKNYYLVIVF